MAANTLNITATVTDNDGDSASDTLDIGAVFNFADDGPSVDLTAAQGASLSVDETSLNTQASITAANLFGAAIDAGSDGQASVAYSLSLGSQSATGLTDTASGEAIVLQLNNDGSVSGVTATGGDVVFNITIDGASGDVSLTQLRAISHPDGSDANDVATMAANTLNITATVTDNDGDSASDTLDIGAVFNFADDGPSVDLTAAQGASLSVDETSLGTAATITGANLFGATIDAGADGVDSVAYSLAIGSQSATGLTDTASGEAIVLELQNDGSVHGVTATGGLEVFSISIDSSSGDVTLNQARAISHPDGSNADDALAMAANTLNVTATITDNDGDTATDSVDIGAVFNFKDDGPYINLSGVQNASVTVDETSLGTAATITGANLFGATIDAGADGVDSVAYSLALGSTSSTGLTDTASGEAIVLELQNDGSVHGVTATGGLEVFSISIDSSSGDVTLNQARAISHPDGSNADDALAMAANTLNVTATITDNDGDTATDSVDIGAVFNFKDDGPYINLSGVQNASVTVDETSLGTAATITGANLFGATIDAGADGVDSVAYSLAIGSQSATGLTDTASGEAIVLELQNDGSVHGVTATGGLEVFSISIDSSSGDVTLNQARAISHPDGSNADDALAMAANTLNVTATITDNDGDTATDSVDIGAVFNFKDDGPYINLSGVQNASVTVDETSLGTAATITGANLFGATIDAGADGVDSVAYSLAIGSQSATGLTDTASGEAIVLELQNDGSVHGVTATGGLEVFSISIDSSSGDVTLNQARAISHPDGSNADDALAMAANTLNVTATITDNDGDTATDSVDIGAVFNFKDDGPYINLSGVQNASVTVDETSLGTAATITGANLFGATIDAGADGVDSVAYSLAIGSQSATGLTDTASGEAIVLELQNDGSVHGVTATGGLEVFSISIDSSSGDVTLNQARAISHPDGSNADDALAMAANTLNVTATITDNDGDTATDSVDIGAVFNFADDGPSVDLTAAQGASLSVDETSLNTQASITAANLFGAAIDAGSDGQASVAYSLSLGSQSATGLTDTASGEAIVLQLNNDGSVSGVTATGGDVVFNITIDGSSGDVSLTQLRAISHPDGSDANDVATMAANTLNITATVTDNDGDSASDTLDIGAVFNFADDGPSVDLTAAQGASLSVDETSLNTQASITAANLFGAAIDAGS